MSYNSFQQWNICRYCFWARDYDIWCHTCHIYDHFSFLTWSAAYLPCTFAASFKTWSMHSQVGQQNWQLTGDVDNTNLLSVMLMLVMLIKLSRHTWRFSKCSCVQDIDKSPWLVGRSFSEDGKESSSSFPCNSYSAAVKEGSYDIKGDRVTKLGCNMWVVRRQLVLTHHALCTGTTCVNEHEKPGTDTLVNNHASIYISAIMVMKMTLCNPWGYVNVLSIYWLWVYS